MSKYVKNEIEIPKPSMDLNVKETDFLLKLLLKSCGNRSSVYNYSKTY